MPLSKRTIGSLAAFVAILCLGDWLAVLGHDHSGAGPSASTCPVCIAVAERATEEVSPTALLPCSVVGEPLVAIQESAPMRLASRSRAIRAPPSHSPMG